MKERPILFSAKMVLAILAGWKTQTRRIVNVSPKAVLNAAGIKKGLTINAEAARYDYPVKGMPRLNIPFRHPEDPLMAWEDCACMTLYAPHGGPGDRLWVKETFVPSPEHPRCRVAYRADQKSYGLDNGIAYKTEDSLGAVMPRSLLIRDRPFGSAKWKPSIFMPRWASRITLEITNVRVERLQEITEEDAWAEGCKRGERTDNGGWFPAEEPDPSGIGIRGWDCAKDWYADLWESINGPGSWDKNQWVWVIEFKRL